MTLVVFRLSCSLWGFRDVLLMFSRDIFVRVYTHDRGEPQMFVEWVLRTGSIRHRETAHVHVTRLHAADFSR